MQRYGIGELRLTFGEGFDIPATRNHVCEHDAGVQRDANNACPPADEVANEVDLLLAFRLGPETDTGYQERPDDGSTGVWMRRSQARVML